MSAKDEWKLATWPNGEKLEMHYIDGKYVGEWREPKTDWIEQLEQARDTLTLLRGSIRGNSPSQKQMSDRLLDAINIVSAQITIEEVLTR